MSTKETSVLELEIPADGVDRHPLDTLLSISRPSPHKEAAPEPMAPPATIIGRLCGFSESGAPLVDFSGNPAETPVQARHTCNITRQDAGREAVLIFEHGNLRNPIILGLLHAPPVVSEEAGTKPVDVTMDGEQITFTAKNEIVLRCGKASITLTRAGKIIIRGAYLLSRSSGVNRIKGGSVQIN